MAEGLTSIEVARVQQHHGMHDAQPSGPRARRIQIAEAALLALVTVVTAWAGFAAAKWSTESRVRLARASSVRSEASRADLQSMELRNFDASTFNTWFTAYAVDNQQGMAVAARRFR